MSKHHFMPDVEASDIPFQDVTPAQPEVTRIGRETNPEMAQKQSELKELMSDMTEVAELRLQLEDMTQDSDPGIRNKLEAKLSGLAKMRMEKRQAVDQMNQRIVKNMEQMKHIDAWGDITNDDRMIIKRLEKENEQLAELVAQKAKEVEPFVKGSIYKKDDFVNVARTLRDVHGKPFGESEPEGGWVVVDSSDPSRILVQGMEAEKLPDGREEFPQKTLDAATLERWNAT